MTILLIAGIVAGIAIYTYLPHLQASFPLYYANLELIGINHTYNTNQIIKFQVKATGYGVACDMPAITIYKSDDPSVIVFERKVPALMCPVEHATLFDIVYPSKNETYSLTVKDASKYTVVVSFLQTAISEGFTVIPLQNDFVTFGNSWKDEGK